MIYRASEGIIFLFQWDSRRQGISLYMAGKKKKGAKHGGVTGGAKPKHHKKHTSGHSKKSNKSKKGKKHHPK